MKDQQNPSQVNQALSFLWCECQPELRNNSVPAKQRHQDFEMPLYVPKTEIIKTDAVKSLGELFIKSKGFIFCAPEYNGGSPPILTNAITWLSVITDNWRSTFVNKKAIIATHSGGAGFKFLTSFTILSTTLYFSSSLQNGAIVGD